MNTLHYLKTMLACVLAMTLFACGSDDDGTDLVDSRLCKTWVEEYMDTDDDGTALNCVHKLIFTARDHSGQEILEESRADQPGTLHTTTRDFTWQWQDDAKECLVLQYGAGEVKYFENIWVRDHYLSGKLDGRVVMLVDINYRH